MSLWLGLLLAWLPVQAGNLKASGSAYPAVPAGWAGALPAALPAPLAGLDLKDPVQRQSFAPVANALGADLGLSPERFRALPPSERAAALSLAVDAARGDLKARVERLSAQARSESRDGAAADRADRVRLYGTAAGLHEIRSRYAGYLDGETQALLERGWARASARAYKTAELLLGRAEAPEAAVEEAPPSAAAREPKVTGGARKTLEGMKASRAGWTMDDFRSLFLGHGFEEKVGAKHVIFVHPAFPELRKSVSRSSGPLAKGYSTAAIRLIERLQELQASAAPQSRRAPARPPKEISLDDLAILLSPP